MADVTRSLPGKALVAGLVVLLTGCTSCNSGGESAKKNELKPLPADVSAMTSRVALSTVTTQQIDYPVDGVQLGNGWNTGTGAKTSSMCISFNERQDTAQSKNAEVRSIVDQSSLMNELNVSVSVQVRSIVPVPGGPQLTAKAEFARKTEVHDEDSNFLVHGVVKNGAVYVAPSAKTGRIELSPWALKLAKNDKKAFLTQCGDSFVAAVFGGAELYSVIAISEHSASEKQRMFASMDGAGYGLELNASVTSTIEKYSKSSQLKMVYNESGGRGDPIATDQQSLLDKLKNLPALAASHPQNFTMSIQRYDTLGDWPAGPQDWLYTSFADIGTQYGRLYSLWSEVHSMTSDPGKVVLDRGVTLSSLNALEGKLLDHARSISKAAKDCIDSDGKNCALDKADRVSDYTYRAQLPALRDSFAEDTELRRATGDVARLQGELTAVHDFEFRKLKAFLAAFKVSKPDAEIESNVVNADPYKNKARELSQAQQVLSQDQAAYPAALKTAIVAQWIRRASDLRCKRDINDAGCLKPTEIDDLAAKVTVN